MNDMNKKTNDSKPSNRLFELLKGGVKQYQSDIILVIAIVLISATSFNLGKISALRNIKTPVTITQTREANIFTSQKPSAAIQPTVIRDQTIVASKNSKLYHFTWCPGAVKIADKNKLTFINEAAAIAAGLTLAGNCSK